MAFNGTGMNSNLTRRSTSRELSLHRRFISSLNSEILSGSQNLSKNIQMANPSLFSV